MNKPTLLFCLLISMPILANSESPKFFIHIFSCDIPIYGDSYTLLSNRDHYDFVDNNSNSIFIREYDDTFETLGKKSGEILELETQRIGLSVKVYAITHLNENPINSSVITLITDQDKIISFFGEEGKSWERKLDYCEQSKLKR